MRQYPVAQAHREIEECACALIKQLEEREQDPITLLVGDGPQAAPVPFHRTKFHYPDGGWCWEAVDDQGRSVRSGVMHDEPPKEACDEAYQEELALSGFPD